mmetsp:Transcript_39312/g.97120  ORF Transcript_39312/g.97120 Transcript_39312/m.97120 type:complete len:205 (+) Transcript_39312:1128-1742(+)
MPLSTTARCSRVQPSLAWGDVHTRTVIAPPGSVNLEALDKPLLRHCSSRRASPMNRSERALYGSSSNSSVIPLRATSGANATSASFKRRVRSNGRRTSVILPESMRSKSSMSETIPSMSLEQVRSASIEACTLPSPTAVGDGKSARDSATVHTASSGERRSCITTRIRFERAVVAASALEARKCSSTSCRLSLLQRPAELRTEE